MSRIMRHLRLVLVLILVNGKTASPRPCQNGIPVREVQSRLEGPAAAKRRCGDQAPLLTLIVPYYENVINLQYQVGLLV